MRSSRGITSLGVKKKGEAISRLERDILEWPCRVSRGPIFARNSAREKHVTSGGEEPERAAARVEELPIWKTAPAYLWNTSHHASGNCPSPYAQGRENPHGAFRG